MLALQPDEDGILRVLREESDRHRKNNLAFRTFCFAILLFMVWATFAGHVEWSSLLTIVGLAGASLATGGRHKWAAQTAAQLQDPRSLPFLVEFLDSEDRTMKGIAEEAVRRILDVIEETSFRCLDERHRKTLVKTLSETTRLDLAAAILGVAKRGGGPEWIRPLEQYTSERSPMRSRDRERATVLAKMALADIRMRAAKQKIDEVAGPPLDEYAADVLKLSNQ